MAWIEDAEQKVLLVRQAVGLRLWTLPGGKVKRGESLVKALRRELYEETGLRAQIGSLLGVLDRRDKDAITLLFVAVPSKNSNKVQQNNKEKRGLSGVLTEESFTIRQILLVGQERPSKEGSENSGFNSPVPTDRVNEIGLYHVNACLHQACCGSAARTEMRLPAVYEQADRTRRRR